MTTPISLILKSFRGICIECLKADIIPLAVISILIISLWLLTSYENSYADERIPDDKRPRPPADISNSITFLKIIIRAILTKSFAELKKYTKMFRLEKLYSLVAFFVRVLKWIYGIHGNKWDFLRAFKTALIFYFLIIPLPAAFLRPVGHQQISPDSHLLAATVILIVINAIGDALSVNFSVRIFQTALKNWRNKEQGESAQDRFSIFSSKEDNPVLKEVQFYTTLLFDSLVATVILILVLMGSSIMFGIQVGEFKFESDWNTISLMLDSAADFWRLTGKFYWFAYDPNGFYGYPGIPGMFFLGISTFLPTLFIGISAVIWLFILPIRIAVSQRIGKYKRLLVSEAVLYIMCVVFKGVASFDLNTFYGFFITT